MNRHFNIRSYPLTRHTNRALLLALMCVGFAATSFQSPDFSARQPASVSEPLAAPMKLKQDSSQETQTQPLNLEDPQLVQ